MKTHIHKMIWMLVLSLSAYTSLAAAPPALPPPATPILPTAFAVDEISPAENVPQALATTSKIDVGLILGNFLILCLYSFPMSIGEGWALSSPMKAKKQPSVVVGLVGGGCLMTGAVVAGAIAFALYYLFSDQPEKVSQIVPRFAYWFPFALLGLVTNVPFTFHIFDLADRRRKVLLRLMVWWLPRLVIVAFMINLPILQELDPATTALAVLVIDGVLAVFFLWLYMSRKQPGITGV